MTSKTRSHHKTNGMYQFCKRNIIRSTHTTWHFFFLLSFAVLNSLCLPLFKLSSNDWCDTEVNYYYFSMLNHSIASLCRKQKFIYRKKLSHGCLFLTYCAKHQNIYFLWCGTNNLIKLRRWFHFQPIHSLFAMPICFFFFEAKNL